MANGIVTAAVLACLVAAGSAFDTKTVTFKSEPIKLKYGQVNNKYQAPMDLPAELVEEFSNGTVAILDYKVDIVDEEGNQVPLFHTYNHHYVALFGTKDWIGALYDIFLNSPFGVPSVSDLTGWVVPANETGKHMYNVGTEEPAGDELTVQSAKDRRSLQMNMDMVMQSSGGSQEDVYKSADNLNYTGGFGGGAGAEMRGLNSTAPPGYAYFISKPEQWTPLFHFINTRNPNGDDGVTNLLECPCTPQRDIDVANGTVDGWVPFPPFGTCNAEFEESGNPSCNLDTYVGGWRCCEDGIFLIDTNETNTDELPEDTVFGTFTITYITGMDAEETGLKPLDGAAAGDVTGSTLTNGNIEYDVPQCASGTAPEDCVYEMTTVQRVSGSINATDDDLLAIPYMVAHLHYGGIDFSTYNDATGELLCTSKAEYGNGTEPGNEAGYLVNMTPCYFEGEDIPVMKATDLVRHVARYNATEPHTGVMALWTPKAHKVVKEQ